MMVAYIAVGLNIPFAVFLYSGFVEGIPSELDEAALIDGLWFHKDIFPYHHAAIEANHYHRYCFCRHGCME